MKKYEAMVIIKPDLSEEAKKNLCSQISDAITKSGGVVTQTSIWAEKKKLFFPLKKYREGTFYLVNFDVAPEAIVKIRHTYTLNEDILRVLTTLKK